ncbi:MAG TPA: GAF and ANTAR domain-containing protein [Nitrospiria bacterium]|nr:GAF and ANTAR domain-containing protein [Nitrospiria bacterium]HUK56898.1 GAF and ANTAR domain-containing protein [Nitrospiria bacterium]
MITKEKRLKTDEEKIAQLKRSLSEKARELDLLRQISESISCNLDLDNVLKQIIDIVVQVTKADACLLYLYNDRNKELILRATKNPHPKLIGRVRLELGEGITGWVARERKLVAIAKNAHDDPRFRVFQNLPEDRYQAFLSIPVVSKNEVIGVINVQHKRPHHHSAGELALLTTIGHQVGGAIENARLYEEMKKKAIQIETLSQVSKTIASNRYLREILQLIVAMTAEMMNSTICSIMLLDEAKQELEIVATQSLSEEYRKKPNLKVGQSISGQAVQERRPIAVLDVTHERGYMYADLARKEGLRSLLSVPMMIKDRVVGVINSYTSHEHKFYDEEIKILQAVANQSAVSIENTKLVRQSNEMQEALENRKAVERAKGVLMREKRIGEDEAFRIIQRQSMNTRRSMKEISEAIILASEIK